MAIDIHIQRKLGCAHRKMLPICRVPKVPFQGFIASKLCDFQKCPAEHGALSTQCQEQRVILRVRATFQWHAPSK